MLLLKLKHVACTITAIGEMNKEFYRNWGARLLGHTTSRFCSREKLASELEEEVELEGKVVKKAE